MKKPRTHWLRTLVFTLFSAYSLVANCTAITLDEIDLMLRSGFSSETIIRENLVGGRVYGTFDAEREKEFRELGCRRVVREGMLSESIELRTFA
jgi:cytosine/adenosine deaminase-related metal-dependent hydrolase